VRETPKIEVSNWARMSGSARVTIDESASTTPTLAAHAISLDGL